MTIDALFTLLGTATIAAPLLLLALMGITMLVGFPLSERATARCTQLTVVAGLAMAIGILMLMLITGRRDISVDIGDLVVIPEEHFHFHVRFMFDRLSVPFVILSFVLLGTIGGFANRYLHKEAGFRRFFLLYAIFLVGMVVASLAGTIETLFLGWELVGLSSALLVAFFHERTAPVMNGQRVWSVYRIADAAFLVAAVALHHLTGEGNFSELMGRGAWPEGQAALTSQQALFIGLLLLVAAAGKSALIPFSGWLPRAMEGPTPSSAVFYGALSVHLGAFLLLRVSPLLELSWALCAIVVLLGSTTALFATMAARVQTDVKSALAFASLTQVGIITAEIGLGFRYLALVHIIGHACLRTLQLLRAPTLLHDYHNLENAIGDHLPAGSGPSKRWTSERARLRWYRLSLERGYLDAIINEYCVRPVLGLFRWCDRMEQTWTRLLGGAASQPAKRIPPAPSVEDLL
ncbi:MAG: proton-conducting transporter membrane subunit [Pirellulales bacterium]